MVNNCGGRTTTVAAMVALALCTLHWPASAYPASLEHGAGDGNGYQPIRNSPTRDLDRFIGGFCVGDGRGCGRPVAKRDSLDRLNGGHTMASKRDSLDRLNGGLVMASKRDSLDRLNGNFLGYAANDQNVKRSSERVRETPRATVDRLGPAGPVMARRGLPSARARPKYLWMLRQRWADYVQRFGEGGGADGGTEGDDDYVDVDDDDDYYYFGNGCAGCWPAATSSY